MHVQSKQFWVEGPPPGIYEGLLSSGLVKKKGDLPIVVPEKSKEQPKKVAKSSSNLGMKESARPMKHRTATNLQFKVDLASLPIAETDNSTAVTLRSRYRPPPIEDILTMQPTGRILPPEMSATARISSREVTTSREKSYITKKDSHSLLTDFLILEEESKANTSCLTVEDEASYKQKLLSKFYLKWNELILQIKNHNSDHAKMLYIIKSYFQEILQQVPVMASKYRSKIEDIQKTNDMLRSHISTLEGKNEIAESNIKQLKAKLDFANSNIETLKNELKKENDEKKEGILAIEDLRQSINDAGFKMSKIEDQKAAFEQLADQRNEMIETLRLQISKQDAIINKYEEEGAGFRPMYTKAMEDISDLKAKLNLAQGEINTLKEKAPMDDIATDPIPELVASIEVKNKKGSKINRRSVKLTTNVANIKSSAKEVNILPDNSVAKFTINEEKNISRSHEIIEQKSIGKINSEFSSTSVIPEEEPTNPEEPIKESEQPIPQDKDKSTEIIKMESTTSLELSKSSTAEELTPEQSREIIIPSTAVPDDYQIDVTAIAENPAMINYVFRLYPTPFTEAQEDSDFFVIPQSDLKNGTRKSLIWTLRQVMFIMRNGFEYDSVWNYETTIRDIIRTMLVKVGRNAEIIDRLESSLLVSISHHRSASRTIRFFMRFVSGELNISSFRFFNILFSMCYNALYPAVKTVLDDPDLADDNESFLIHADFADRLAADLLMLDHFPPDVLNDLRKRAPRRAFPDLLSFWDFAGAMVNLFAAAHVRFHRQARNILRIVGATDFEHLTPERFLELMRILDPEERDGDARRVWKAVALEAGGAEHVTAVSIFRHAGETPALAEKLVGMPYAENFERKFIAMPEHVVQLFLFLRKRYTDLVPRILAALDTDLRSIASECVIKMRNSFLRCDVESCFMHYRHMLQTIDNQMTSANPYIVFGASTTPDDTQHLTQLTMMRECIACVQLNVTSGSSAEDILAGLANN